MKGPVLGLPLARKNVWRGWSAACYLRLPRKKIRHAVWRGGISSGRRTGICEGRWQFDDDKLNTLHHLGAARLLPAASESPRAKESYAATSCLSNVSI